MTKNIKVSDKLAERLATHRRYTEDLNRTRSFAFHNSYADIIESLLNFYEKQRPGKRVTDEK
jgi:hypothetical protein